MKKIFGAIVLIGCVAGISACSSDDDENQNENDNVIDPIEDGVDNDDDPDSGTPIDDRLNATALYRNAECGTLPVSETDFSNDPASPAFFSEAELVGGRIDPNSTTNTLHYWNIQLQAGFYHILLDSSRVDDADSNIGLTLVDVSSENSTQLIRGNQIDYRTRLHTFLEIENDQTLTLQVNAGFSGEDYLLGIFPNGASIPAPYFDDCPTVNPISLGETIAVDLPDGPENADRDRWYSIDLSIGDYLLSSSAMRQDANVSNIIYEFLAFEQYAQATRAELVFGTNDIDISSDTSGVLNRSEPGTVWMRLRNNLRNAPNGDNGLSIQFTLQDDS